MIVHAAIDLMRGDVVQLAQGDPSREHIRRPDPARVADDWQAAGAPWLHVVDLDAALDRGSNTDGIRAVLGAARVPVQVGGGFRAGAAVAEWLAAGAARVIVGTRAVRDPAWLAEQAHRFPDRVVLAADTRGGTVVAEGWSRSAELTVEELLEIVDELPLAAVLVTDVNREGLLRGADTDMFGQLASSTAHPLIAAGGIRRLEDLKALEQAGVAEAVIGTALYTGAITTTELQREYWK